MIRDGITSGDFHVRKTAISAILKLGLEVQLADLIQKAAEDPVANVRIVLAMELPRNSEVLNKLKADPDRDVADYASKP
jgi:HEAT repeat protein